MHTSLQAARLAKQKITAQLQQGVEIEEGLQRQESPQIGQEVNKSHII